MPATVIVAVDGQVIRVEHDFGDPHWNFEPGKPILLTVERAGQRMQLTIVLPQRRVWETLDHAEWLRYGLDSVLRLVYLGLGLLVLFARPRDWGAVIGAILVLGSAASGSSISNGYAALFRQLPLLLQACKLC